MTGVGGRSTLLSCLGCVFAFQSLTWWFFLHQINHEHGSNDEHSPSAVVYQIQAKAQAHAYMYSHPLRNVRPSSNDHADADPTISNYQPSSSWLTLERFTNADGGIARQDVHRLIASGAHGLGRHMFHDTVCSTDSPLYMMPELTAKEIYRALENLKEFDGNKYGGNETIKNGKKAAFLRHWIGGAVYAAVHEMQYGPAREEAKARVAHWDTWERQHYRAATSPTSASNDPNENANTRNTRRSTIPWISNITQIGRMDYECPTAKFLVVEDQFSVGVGLGSSLRRWNNIPPFLLALRYNRTVLYLQNKKPVAFAGCPRGDLQCSFLPMSPCVLTRTEYEEALTIPSRGGMESFLIQHREERVIRYDSMAGRMNPRGAALQDAIVAILVSSRPTDTGDNDKAALRNAVEKLFAAFAEQEKEEHGISYQEVVESAIRLFIARPSMTMKERIGRAIANSFPNDYDASKSIGMPIRASDKCQSEAKCIPFHSYLEQLQWNYSAIVKPRHVILTSEDEAILKESQNTVTNSSPHPFTFITNKDDVMQGHGWLDKVGKGTVRAERGKHLTKEDVMTSTMAAWAFQMKAGHHFLNLCSNFHVIMADSIRIGCSASTSEDEIVRQNVVCKRK